MPEGDLRDLYGVMKRVSSGRWRSGLRLTAEKDEEKLQEKYGNFWLEKSGKTRWKPPSVAEQAGVASETVNEAESGAGDDDDGSREMPARPVAAAVSETNEVGVAKGLEELLREAEAELEGREVFVVEAAEAATAVLADEVEAAETEEVDEVAIEETEILWDENQDEDETLVPKPAQAVDIPPRFKTSHDSFSSMSPPSPPNSDDDVESKQETRVSKIKALQEKLEALKIKVRNQFGKLRRAATEAKERVHEINPETLRKAETVAWKVGCFCVGFVGVVVLSKVRAPQRSNARKRRVAKNTKPKDLKPQTPTEASLGGRTEVASPRILKEVFSP